MATFVNMRRTLNKQKLTLAGIIFLFLLPGTVIYVLFLIYPMIQAMHYSLFNWNGLGPLIHFVKLQNYIDIISDKIFSKALINSGLLILVTLLIQLPMGLGIALMVRGKFIGRKFFRTIFFLPYVFSEVVTGVIWLIIYNPQFGVLNYIGSQLIPGFKPYPFTGNPHTILIWLFIAMTWKYFGYHLILYLAGLANIPREIEEAAIIDGASPFQSLRYVVLPLIGNTIRLTIYIAVVGTMQEFGLFWIMTNGGPNHASELLATYMYKFGFLRFQLGYGNAIAVLLFLICLTFSLLYQGLVMNRDYGFDL
jgi:raffinose/stachyose/melibiose transport system permease protein